MGSLEVTSPLPNQLLRVPTLCPLVVNVIIFATNIYCMSTRYQPCAKCLGYGCEQNGQRTLSSCSQHGAQKITRTIVSQLEGKLEDDGVKERRKRLNPARSRAPGWREQGLCI